MVELAEAEAENKEAEIVWMINRPATSHFIILNHMDRISVLIPVFLLLITSCSNKEDADNLPDTALESIIFTLEQYRGDADTKTTYDTESMYFLWAEGDAVGIVSPSGSQLKFSIRQEDYGQQYAHFDGRGFALISGTSYASYYPFLPDFDLVPEAIPIRYDGQLQSGNNSLAHLGAYSYTVAMGTAPEAGTLNFTFRNVGSPHRYSLPVEAGVFRRLSLQIPSEKYIIAGTLDLSAQTEDQLKTITPSTFGSRLDIDLENASVAETGMFRCWAMLPPANLEGDVIRLFLEADDGSVYIASVAGRDCPANTRRVFNAQSSVYPAFTLTGSEEVDIVLKVVKNNDSVEVNATPNQDWITAQGNNTEGRVTTFTFHLAANTGAEREGTVSFTETASGLTNTVTVRQSKAGSIIGIGGWSTENHSGQAQ